MSDKLFKFDKNFNTLVIGTDEAGRGPGAGPVYAAAVYFPNVNSALLKILNEINDSKKLTETKREELYELIKQNTVYSIQSSTVEEIEKMNILQASLNTMKKACLDVIKQIDKKDLIVLIDGNKLIPNFNYPQKYIIKGDATSASIAAASILAKVERDKFMCELHNKHPQYGWDRNKGYLTQEHIDAISQYGLTKWHRKKFVRNINCKQLSLTN